MLKIRIIEEQEFIKKEIDANKVQVFLRQFINLANFPPYARSGLQKLRRLSAMK